MVYLKKSFGENKKVFSKSKHLRFNWRESPESSEDLPLTRYYFDVVDNKFREQKIEQILGGVQNQTIINFKFNEITPSYEGKVEGTNLRYLCRVYDSNCSPELVKKSILEVFGNSYVVDKNLYDRSKKGTSLELYLSKLHSNK
jgi:muramoyltetrapeptide carboxypeptidase LdcA involved in peptidoglycan recycling